MPANKRLLRPNGTAFGRTFMTQFRYAMIGLNLALNRLKQVKISKKRFISALLAALVVALIGIAAATWWFRSVPITYKWGSYASCPTSWINTSDPSWEADPLINMKGGEKTTPFIQAEHIVACGIPIVRNEKERLQFIKSGRLERLEAEHIVLWDVEEPYVNPLMLLFVTRLSDQYYAANCGDLDVTGALRNLERHRTLKNGSPHSLHPYGMGLDLRIPADNRCRVWLRDALIGAERHGRVDVGEEGVPAHFHVSLVPGAYEAWLMNELGIKAEVGYDIEEVRWLTTALFFEGAIKEPEEGLQAIASVIKNRRDSAHFHGTNKAVVARGANGQKNGGCQFSFMCDGLPEQPSVVCEQHPKDTVRLWGNSYPCGLRWAQYHALAVKFMTAPDNTLGALHYYTGRKPWWADKEMKRPTQIGSHIFG